jgi:hypothetical protein
LGSEQSQWFHHHTVYSVQIVNEWSESRSNARSEPAPRMRASDSDETETACRHFEKSEAERLSDFLNYLGQFARVSKP